MFVVSEHASSLLILADRKAIRLRASALRRDEGRDADLSRQANAPLITARNDAANPRPVIVLHRRRRGRFFTLGGGSAGRVRVGVFCAKSCASSRLFMFGGLLLRFAQPRRGASRSITSLVASGEHWPTALQRSDGKSLRAAGRCRIDLCAMLGRRDVRATHASRGRMRLAARCGMRLVLRRR